AANKLWARLGRMTSTAEDTPALLMAKPTWLVSQVSWHAHRLLAAGLAGAGARGYHVRVLAALAEFGPASQASLGRRARRRRARRADRRRRRPAAQRRHDHRRRAGAPGVA